MSPLVTLASWAVGPIQFDRPMWLVLWPILAVLTLLIARRSLSGLGGPSKWVALSVRLLVLALLIGALADPQIRRTSDDVSVTVVLDVSRSVPASQQIEVDRWLDAARTSGKRPDDYLGLVTAAEDALLQSLPSRGASGIERVFTGEADGTNLADGLQLALAGLEPNAANRLVLISDGNETDGSLLAAAEQARALGVPVDVLPLRFRYENEVIVDRVAAPATARLGETINVRVVVTATHPAEGRLTLLENGEPIDLDPDTEGLGVRVRLDAGPNVLTVPIASAGRGPQEYTAVFEPTSALSDDGLVTAEGSGDRIEENNRASSVTFVETEGLVAVVAADPREATELMQALADSRVSAELMLPESLPESLAGLNQFEAVVLLNASAYSFSGTQLENLYRYVHDSGGGLVMIGGPESFGAGGWIGSPIEDALPIVLDPPQKRQMPRGALALVVHSVEMPRGVYYGRQVCNAAVDALSRLDLIGIVEFSTFAGVDWVYQMSPVGDRTAVKRAINQLSFGDMPNFDPSLELALAGLQASDAGQKHTIVISDGDPSLSNAVLSKFAAAGISISTVGVFPHSPGDYASLRRMAQRTGGTFYAVNTQAALATLPQIFIKEAQTVRRALIWEGDPFSPTVLNAAAEPMRGIRGVPPISGYIVAAERGGLAQTTLRGKEEDPIAAIWPFGLGKVVAFTSDATTRWAGSWTNWEGYRQFWEQHVRWAMRPSGSAEVRMTTEPRGDETAVIVDAFTPDGERLNFAQFRARLSKPDGTAEDVNLRQVGPGRYEAVVDSADPGSYVLGVRYRAPNPDGEGPALEGSAQAAITRAFADEFRALEDNAALLEQVAAVTGGQVLPGDPAQADLWRRDGLEKPVSTTPVWLTVALIAIGLFLTDVGVRRVRIDPAGIGRSILRALGTSTTKAGEQMDTLRPAREQARQRYQQQGEDAKRVAETRAKRKFEADPADASAASGPVVSTDRPAGAPLIDKPEPAKPKKSDESEEEGMSRLMRAKRRAQEDFNKDEDNG